MKATYVSKQVLLIIIDSLSNNSTIKPTKAVLDTTELTN